jgi:hypothetical protein
MGKIVDKRLDRPNGKDSNDGHYCVLVVEAPDGSRKELTVSGSCWEAAQVGDEWAPAARRSTHPLREG